MRNSKRDEIPRSIANRSDCKTGLLIDLATVELCNLNRCYAKREPISPSKSNCFITARLIVVYEVI